MSDDQGRDFREACEKQAKAVDFLMAWVEQHYKRVVEDAVRLPLGSQLLRRYGEPLFQTV